MIHMVWPYLALMLLVAGLFPTLEWRFGWRVFSVQPPIVFTYLLVTALAVSGLWQVNAEIQAAQKLLIGQLVPGLLFLLMVNCDLRAIFALGPRVLGVFACTSISLFIAFVATYLMFRNVLPAGNGWQPLAALSGSWVGGIGGVAATPVLAASYAPVLVPVSILLALLGYILGTGFGLVMATVLSALAPT